MKRLICLLAAIVAGPLAAFSASAADRPTHVYFYADPSTPQPPTAAFAIFFQPVKAANKGMPVFRLCVYDLASIQADPVKFLKGCLENGRFDPQELDVVGRVADCDSHSIAYSLMAHPAGGLYSNGQGYGGQVISGHIVEFSPDSPDHMKDRYIATLVPFGSGKIESSESDIDYRLVHELDANLPDFNLLVNYSDDNCLVKP